MKPIGSNLRLPTWLADAGQSLEQIQRDTSIIDVNLNHLQRLLENIELQGCILSTSNIGGETEVSGCYYY